MLVTGVLLLAATVIGVYLTAAAGLWVLAFALSGAFVLMFYSGGPIPLKYFGMGEIAVFIVWGPLMIGGSYYVMAEHLPWWVILASVPYGLGVTTVLFGKHLDKLSFDKAKGIRTMPIVLGEKAARYTTMALAIAMYAATAALAVWQGMWALVLVIGALPLLWQMLQFYSKPKPAESPEWYRGWPLWFVAIAFIHNRRFGLLFVTGLGLQLALEAAFIAPHRSTSKEERSGGHPHAPAEGALPLRSPLQLTAHLRFEGAAFVDEQSLCPNAPKTGRPRLRYTASRAELHLPHLWRPVPG